MSSMRSLTNHAQVKGDEILRRLADPRNDYKLLNTSASSVDGSCSGEDFDEELDVCGTGDSERKAPFGGNCTDLLGGPDLLLAGAGFIDVVDLVAEVFQDKLLVWVREAPLDPVAYITGFESGWS